MYYVYLLHSKTGRFYVGYSTNLGRRITEHKLGQAQTTRNMGSVELVYFEAYSDIDLAVVFDNIGQGEAFLFRKRLLGNCPDNVDVQVYNILPDKIKSEIDKKGSVIYEK